VSDYFRLDTHLVEVVFLAKLQPLSIGKYKVIAELNRTAYFLAVFISTVTDSIAHSLGSSPKTFLFGQMKAFAQFVMLNLSLFQYHSSHNEINFKL